jgi:hypothetical protein
LYSINRTLKQTKDFVISKGADKNTRVCGTRIFETIGPLTALADYTEKSLLELVLIAEL